MLVGGVISKCFVWGPRDGSTFALLTAALVLYYRGCEIPVLTSQDSIARDCTLLI